MDVQLRTQFPGLNPPIHADEMINIDNVGQHNKTGEITFGAALIYQSVDMLELLHSEVYE